MSRDILKMRARKIGIDHLASPEFLAINPNGKVPALVDGEVKLWESVAIMAYLSESAGADLWPKNTADQIEVLRWLMWDATHFSRHAATLYVENFVRKAFNMGAPNPAAIEEASGFFKQFAAILDAHLAKRLFLVADRWSIADFAVASFLPDAEKAGLPIAGFTHIGQWHARLLELPAWRAPFPVP